MSDERLQELASQFPPENKNMGEVGAMARELLALRAAHAEVCRERDAAVKLRNLDAEFVCGFMRVVREGETRVPPILAEKWVKAAKLFLEEGRTEKVEVPSDESWKDTWERAEQAEAERDELRAILQEQGIIYSGGNTQKGKRFYLQLIERAEQAEAAAARLREFITEQREHGPIDLRCFDHGHQYQEVNTDDGGTVTACAWCLRATPPTEGKADA